MPQILGVEVSNRAISLTLVHTAVETVGMAGWLALTLNGEKGLGFVVLLVTLVVEHILALASGKIA